MKFRAYKGLKRDLMITAVLVILWIITRAM